MNHQPSVTPAEPWRRWLAAAIDAFLLFVTHVFLWLVGVVTLPMWNSMDTFLAVFGAVIGFAYLVAFWRWRGATLGQQAVGIKVVRYDGAPLTWGDALRRLAGYLLAALPWHIGFLSIFCDPYRRGWHDRLARTLVVRRQPTERLLPLPPPALPPEPFVEEPQAPMAWHHWLLATAIYVGLSLCFTYPTVAHFSTHRAGSSGDAGVFMWNFWHTHEALLKGREPLLTTKLLFYPHTVPLLYNTVCWVYSLPAALLLQGLTVTQTYNLFFLISLTTSALATFALARSLRCDFTGALLAGVLLSVSPYVMTHGKEGHLNLIALEFLVLFALVCYRALTRRSLFWTFGAGITFALVGYGEWYYLVFATFLSVCLAIGITLTPRAHSPIRLYVLLLLLYLCGAVCLSPLLVPMLGERTRSRYMDAPLGLTQTYSIDPAYAAFSNSLHPLWGKWVRRRLHTGAEQVGGLSLVAIALSLIAIARRGRQLLPWTLTGIVFLLLACGPILRIGGKALTLPAGVVLLGGGPPGNGLGPPWSADLSLTLARDALTQPQAFWSDRRLLPMPFAWLRQTFAPLRAIRAPGRFIVVTSLCLALLAACGLRLVRHAARQRWGALGERAVIALAVGAVLLEYLPVPYPITSTRVSRFYHEVAKEPETDAIVDVPVGYVSATYNFTQTVHGKPIFGAYLSRVPPEALTSRDRNLLLVNLMPSNGWAVRCSLRVEETIKTNSLTTLRQRFTPSLRELARVGGKYIILHKAMLKASALKQADRLLREALLLPIRWDDSELRVYQIQEVTTDKP